MRQSLPLSRAAFTDPSEHARAMAACGPASADEIDLFVGLPGEAGAVLTAAWGTHAQREAMLAAELRVEQQRRPCVFVEKLPARHGAAARAVLRPGATLLSEADVGAILSAAEFARVRGWSLDFSVTVSPSKLGVVAAAEVAGLLRRYLKCLAQFLRDNGLPCAFVGTVENGAAGLHLHLALHAPRAWRVRVKRWHVQFLRREAKRRGVTLDLAVVAFSRHQRHHPLLGDLLVSYLLKGFDHRVTTQAAADSLDGCDVRLADLMAFDVQDPGEVPFDRVFIGPALNAAARGAWRSSWEQGARRVDQLYAPVFVRFVQRSSRPVTLPGLTEALAMRACADALLDALAADAGVPDPTHAVEACCSHVELVARAFERLAHDVISFDRADYGTPQRTALETLRLSVRATVQAVADAGGRAVELVLAEALPRALVHAVVPALERADEQVRTVAGRVDVPAVSPPWALRLTCAQLQRN